MWVDNRLRAVLVVVGMLASLVFAVPATAGARATTPDFASAPGLPSAAQVSSGADQVAAGESHTCAVQAAGTVNCWGINFAGQLGNGNNASSSTPVPVTGITNATTITAGRNHACALLAGGSVNCWGINGNGQLGNGTNTDANNPVPVGITNATAVVAGFSHTCALLAGGSVNCWGRNSSGELGNGMNANTNTPVPVTGITNATAIAAGERHTCARLADGTVNCWGGNSFGELGNGNNTGTNTPVAVTGITTATAITAGTIHTCAILTDGTVNCWGRNIDGQLGNGNTIDTNTPVAVMGITNATALAAALAHTCALLADGSINCWGSNFYGQLGSGSSNTSSNTPVPVTGISNGTTISAAANQTCAALADGTVNCWGRNVYGQLGNATTNGSLVPSRVRLDASFFGPDGHALVVGDQRDMVGGVQAGSVRIWVDSTLNALPMVIDQGVDAETDDDFGESWAAGDFNGDGIDDLVVGAPGEDSNAGQVWLYEGPFAVTPGAATITPELKIDQDSAGVSSIKAPDEFFGAALLAADLDSDGYDDLVVGVPGQNVGTAVQAGAIHVFFGTANGLDLSTEVFYTEDSLSGFTAAGSNDLFGQELAAGRFDGSDMTLVVGVPGEDIASDTNNGAVVLISDVSSGTVDALLFSSAQHDNVEFGHDVAVGDSNGDGYDDLVVGAPGTNVGGVNSAGAVSFFLGSASGLSVGATLHRNSPNVAGVTGGGDAFGETVSAADVDRDGFADVLIGVPSIGFANAGEIQVLPGSATGLNLNNDYIFDQNTPGISDSPEFQDQFGTTPVSDRNGIGWTDVNNDWNPDVTVFVPNESITGASDTGASHVIYSGSPGEQLGQNGDALVVHHVDGELCNGQIVTVDLNNAANTGPTAGVDVILGTPGPDVISGLSGDDVICGLGGADTIVGGPGDDIIFGDDGNDSLFGLDGQDVLHGGSGADTIVAGNDDDTIQGGPGDDTLNGGPGDDLIHGGSGDDEMFGQGGNDTMNGDGGDDLMIGVTGVDILNGGTGFDTLNGGPGNDTLDGGSDNDTVFGLDGDDTIDGDTGDDQLFGQIGVDTINGGAGDDSIWGNEDNDIITDPSGTNTMNGGPDDDNIVGGSGDDTIYGDGDLLQAGDDTINPGPGQDTVISFNGNDNITSDDGEPDLINAGPNTGDTCTTDAPPLDTVFNCS